MTARNVLWHLDAACTGVDPEAFYPLDLAPTLLAPSRPSECAPVARSGPNAWPT